MTETKGKHKKNQFGDWVKLYDLLSLSWGNLWTLGQQRQREVGFQAVSYPFLLPFYNERWFIVKLCFCRLTCLECQKKNHGDPKPVFPLGHPHTSEKTTSKSKSCKDTKNNQVFSSANAVQLLIVGTQGKTLFSKKDRDTLF